MQLVQEGPYLLLKLLLRIDKTYRKAVRILPRPFPVTHILNGISTRLARRNRLIQSSSCGSFYPEVPGHTSKSKRKKKAFFCCYQRLQRTQIGEPQIWADWECGWLLPLVVLALSGSQKTLQWLLSQFLRYSFCTISWIGIDRLTLTPHEHEQLFFSHRLALHHLLCYQIDACDKSQKGHLGFSVHPFMTYHFNCSQGQALECAQTHRRLVLPLVVLTLEAFQKSTLLHPVWHWRKREIKPRF